MFIKRKAKFAYIISLVVAALLIAVVLPTASGGTAYAQQTPLATGDAFDVVFPLSNYFQSLNPTLISANADYLIVYDSAEKALFARSNSLLTYHYDLSALSDVAGIYAVGSHAFIVTGAAPTLAVYKLDLADTLAEPTLVELPSPANASYIASDGTYLYAKNSAGNLSIFDEDLNVALGVDNVYNYDVLTGKSAIAAENGTIYLFATDDKSVAHLYVFDSAKNELTLDAPSPLIQSAHIGEVIFAQISPSEEVEDHSQIVCLDKTTGDKLCNLEVTPDSYCAFNDTLYTVNDNKISVYRLHKTDDEYSLDREEVISMAGDDLRHLNAPLDATVIDKYLFVADSLNMRVAQVELSTDGDKVAAASKALVPYPLQEMPIALTDDGKSIYILLESGKVLRYLLSSGVLVRDEEFSASLDGATDLQYFDGNLYAIAEGGLYGYFVNDFILCANLSGATAIAAGKDGSALYVMTNGDDGSEIAVFDGMANRLPRTLAGDFQDAVDFAVDCAGDLFVIYKNKVEKYKNNVLTLEKAFEIQLVSSVVRAEATSVVLDGQRLFFTAAECFVGALQVDATSEFEGKYPSISASTPYHFAKQTAQKSFYLPADGGASSLKPLALGEGEAILILDGVTSPYANMLYAMWGDKLILVPADDFETVQPTPINKEYFLRADADLYHIPYLDGMSVSAAKETHVVLLSDCAGYDGGKWSLVNLDGGVYFVDAQLIDEYVPPIYEPDNPPEGEKPKTLYGRAKADRVGGVVYIYDDLHETASLTDIVDGKRIEILAEYADYYKIKYGDVTGYMRKSEVKVGGLTTVQIVAIVLSCAVLIAGTGIFISIHALKKRNDDENLTK